MGSIDEVFGLDEWEVSDLSEGVYDVLDVLVRGADACANGGSAQIDGAEGIASACQADEVAGEGFGVGFKFEAECCEDGILELSSTDFDDVFEASACLSKGEFEGFECGHEILDLSGEGESESGRAGVIGGLLIIDVIEWRDACVISQGFAQELKRAVCNDFVDVHVKGGTCAAL